MISTPGGSVAARPASGPRALFDPRVEHVADLSDLDHALATLTAIYFRTGPVEAHCLCTWWFSSLFA